MKHKIFWSLSLGVLGVVALGLILIFEPTLSPATGNPAAEDDPSLFVLSSKGIGQDPNQVELLARIEAQGSSEGLDFSGRDLTGLDLGAETLADIVELRSLARPPVWLDSSSGSGQLNGINLAGSLLLGADLNRAQLIAANFQNAQLIEADLSQTNLALANLNGANLTTADL